jgi:PAS domain S-box-containing protein
MTPLEDPLQTIIDTIPVLAWSARPDGSIDFFNQQWANYTGMSPDKALDWGWKVAKHPEDLPHILDVFENAARTGQPFEVEGRIRRRDGVFRWFLIRGNPLRDRSGTIVRWYGTDVDIEDRKHAEETLKLLKDRLQDENVVLKEQIDQVFMFDEIIGSSPALKDVLSKIVKVAPTASTVLITGETGTGKERVARAIHKSSPRKNHAFISVNCAAIPSSLITSELFGHEKGAFTGAVQRRRGRFEQAEGGTIFLDEVGELLPDVQTALLRVLQEREFERVGSSQPIKVDVRVIAATNRDLPADVAAGIFRSDLYYRLNVLPIEIPPLRERKDDIPSLVKYFVVLYARKAGKKVPEIDKKSMDLLMSYSWPGNVRELQNLIERAIILRDLTTPFIEPRWLSSSPTQATANSQSTGFKKSTQEQKALIQAALQECSGQVSGPQGAAARLGMPRSTLESKIKAFRINKNFFVSGTSVSK